MNLSCSVRATSRTVEIFIGSERIAAYPRNTNTSKRYITLPEHMPEEHKAVSGWSSDRFLSWAEKIGPHTRELIKQILESREHPVQTYRSCMGIMRFGKSNSDEVMEHTSQEALNKNTHSYKYFNMILKQVSAKVAKVEEEKVIPHDNVRGSSAYAEGGIHA